MANNFNLTSDWIFGGSTVNAAPPDSSLTTNQYYKNLTLNNVTIDTNGFKICCSERLVMTNSIIQSAGAPAVDDSGGYSPMLQESPYGAGMSGAFGNSGPGAADGNPTINTAYNALGGSGGDGGDAGPNSGSVGTECSIANPSWQDIFNLIGGGQYSSEDNGWYPFRAGGGGGAGAKDATSESSGGGGSGGGVVFIAAPIIEMHQTTYCTINATGGAGGVASGPGDAGGGGGGGGGIVILVYHQLINPDAALIIANGGNGGSGVGAGVGGTGGAGGRVILCDLTSGKITSTVSFDGADG